MSIVVNKKIKKNYVDFVELLPIHVFPSICKLIQPRGEGDGDTPRYGLYRYVLRDRVGFLRFLILY